MNILFLSDIHLDINSKTVGRDLLPPLISYIQNQQPELVVFAGDLSDHYQTSLNIIRRIEEQTDIPVRFIPGNHDIWVDGSKNSWDAYQTLANEPSTLINRPYFVGSNHVLIGDMCWYDYSFGTETLTVETFASKKKKLWKDGIYAKWNRSDKDVLSYILDKLEVQLNRYREKKIIFVNHFIPYRDFITFSSSDVRWNIQNGYMGSKHIGELIDRYPNIELAVFGHTHKRYGYIEGYKAANLLCNPLGYTHEWTTDTFEEELEHAGILLSFK